MIWNAVGVVCGILGVALCIGWTVRIRPSSFGDRPTVGRLLRMGDAAAFSLFAFAAGLLLLSATRSSLGLPSDQLFPITFGLLLVGTTIAGLELISVGIRIRRSR